MREVYENKILSEYVQPTLAIEAWIHFLSMPCNFFSLKARCLAGKHFVIFFGNEALMVAWSCRDANPRPSDFQPDAIAIYHV